MNNGHPGNENGTAVAGVTHDAGLFFAVADETRRVHIVSGAPESTDGGRVFAQAVHGTSGMALGMGTELLVPVGSSSFDSLGSPGERVGAALLGVDLLEHLDDTMTRPSFGLIGGGQELLIGAPGGGAQGVGGRVIWFYIAYDDGIDPWDSPNLPRWEYGGWFTVTGLETFARFGESLAAPAVPNGQQVPFVAIGAPGVRRVMIIQPATEWTTGSGPATADPLGGGLLTTLHGDTLAGGGTPVGFGQRLLVDDLNGDGFPDLVISAVGDGLQGRVFVIPGAAWGLNIGARFEITGDGAFMTAGAEFGHALASGNLHDPMGPPTLAIGAPGRAPSGGVCQIQFADGFPTPVPSDPPVVFADCTPSPFLQSRGFSHGHRFGESLAIADFIQQDSAGNTGTPASLLHELAVGAPGLQPAGEVIEDVESMEGTDTFGPFYYYQAESTVLPGAVTIFRSWPTEGALIKLEKRTLDGFEVDGEPVIGRPRGSRWAHTHFLHQFGSIGPQPHQQFAAAMTAVDLAPETGWPDLVIGAPGTTTNRGRVEFTRTTLSMNGWESPAVVGRYSVMDSGGASRTVIVLSAGLDGFRLSLTSFNLGFVRPDGTPCEHEALDDPLTGVTSPLNFALHTDLAGPPVTTSGILVTFTDDDDDDVLRFTADVTHDGNADTLTIAIRQPRVRESGVWVNPFFPNSCVGQSEAPEGFILSGRVAPTCEF